MGTPAFSPSQREHFQLSPGESEVGCGLSHTACVMLRFLLRQCVEIFYHEKMGMEVCQVIFLYLLTG